MNQNVYVKSEPFKSEICVERNVEISVKLTTTTVGRKTQSWVSVQAE